MMFRQIRLLCGISIFWLALSILQDGVNTLVLPLQISKLTGSANQAARLGLLTMIGLLAGALIQPFAGTLSDRWKPVLGRKGFVGIGVVLCLLSLFLFAIVRNLVGLMLGYVLIQVSASLAQAGQQGLIPDLVEERQRGMASGLKGFMDITGAMLGFALLGQLLGANKIALALGVIAALLVITYLLAALLTPEDSAARGGVNRATISLPSLFRLELTQHAAFKRLLLARFLFLFGIYAIGRFLLFFVAQRLSLDANQAAEQAGTILAALAFVTIVASPLTGWLSDRFGRVPLMLAGAILGAISALLLLVAKSQVQILVFGSLMSLGSAAFAGGSWALLADLVPKEESARYFGLANFSTAGATASAGLLGPAIDVFERVSPGYGYSFLFIV
jgi:MFS family permease